MFFRKVRSARSLFLLPPGEGQDEGPGVFLTPERASIPCPTHYDFFMVGTALARKLRKRQTWAEKLVWKWLRDRRFNGYKFRRQHPIGIYSLDFFCEEARLSIELDGSQHGFPTQQKHDAQREAFLKSRGIKTLRFWNSYLRRNEQSVRDTIFHELQARAPHPLPDYTRPGIMR
jgi:very-short-patch-repair endonuclease